MRTKGRLGAVASAIALPLAFFLIHQVVIGQQRSTPVAQRTTTFNLAEFWPLDAPPRKWDLILRAEVGYPQPRILMSVENETIGPGKFILWFSHKSGQRLGERDGELYRICRLPGRTWLFFDTYINSSPGKPLIEHPVASDRILFSQVGGPATGLIRDGEYQACGATGQPYLLWSGAPWHYRIQVWGHLTENPKFKWYWEATVTGPEPVVDDCIRPVERRSAVRVEEAWWDDYQDPAGRWGHGSGEIDPQTGAPNGNNIQYGRTVWHGAGQLPYLMTGKTPAAATHPNWCVNRISVP